MSAVRQPRQTNCAHTAAESLCSHPVLVQYHDLPHEEFACQHAVPGRWLLAAVQEQAWACSSHGEQAQHGLTWLCCQLHLVAGLPLDPETLPPPPNVKPPPRPYPEEAIPSVSMYPYDGMPPPPVPTPPYYTPPAVGPGMLPPAYYPPPPITGAGVTPGVLYPYPGVPPPKHY